MSRPELSETLLALLGAIEPAPTGPYVTEVDLTVPLEIGIAAGSDGRLVVHAAPGHSRFLSGFQPPTHRTRLHIVVVEDS